MRNKDPKRNKMRVFSVLATLCVLAASAKAAPAEDGFVKFHPITQEQYDEILSLTDGKPVISEGRLISSGMAKFAGFTSGLATGWLPSVIKTFSSSSNNSNKRKDQNFPLCVIDTNDLTYDYDDSSSPYRDSPRGSVDSNGYYHPSPDDGYYPPGPHPGSRPPYRPPHRPPPGYPGGEDEEEEEPDTTTDAPSRKKPIVNCIVVIKRPDDSAPTTTTTTTTRKPTSTKRPKPPRPTPNPPEDEEEEEDYPQPPPYGHRPPPPYPYIDPWTMWYYYKLASAYSADQAPPPSPAYPPPYPYPSYPKRPRQNDAVAYVERSSYPQFDYNSEYPKFAYQQSASNSAPYYVRPSLKQPKRIQPEPADSEELEDDKDFFSVRKLFG